MLLLGIVKLIKINRKQIFFFLSLSPSLQNCIWHCHAKLFRFAGHIRSWLNPEFGKGRREKSQVSRERTSLGTDCPCLLQICC